LLHGDNKTIKKHQYLLSLREVNSLLCGGHPHIGLMFGKAKYGHTEVPGFINVPANFNEVELLNYVKTNVAECRKKAKKHVE
jgi:hypothetical protein